MCERKIPSDCSYFAVRNEACRVPDHSECNPLVKFFHLTIFNVTDYVFLTLLDNGCDVYVLFQNSRHGKNKHEIRSDRMWFG